MGCATPGAASALQVPRQLIPFSTPPAVTISAVQRMPDVTVAAVIESGGRFLLVEERVNRRLLFNQPAGHVEHGETLLAAVVRETREETAWRFEPHALLGAYLWRNPTRGGTVLRFAFIGTVSDHQAAQRLDHGIVATHWLSLAELEQRQARLRSPLVLRCVHDYLAGLRHSLERVAELDLQGAASLSARTPLNGSSTVTAVGL
jgi:8-oxo-dGTP pyrophosphatase MutT (NUDIX family)